MKPHKVNYSPKSSVNPDWMGKEIGHLFNSISHSSKIVLYLKIALGVFAILLILLLIIWPITNSLDKKLKMTFIHIPNGEAETPTMSKPQFHGIDRSNRPYTVFADSAVQETSNEMKLTNINGEMSFSDGWISLLSDRGNMNLEAKTIELYDSVTLFTNSGYEFVTKTAHVDMGKSNASGNDPVKVQGPLGILHSNGFIVIGKESKFIFNNGVEATLYPKTNNAKTHEKH